MFDAVMMEAWRDAHAIVVAASEESVPDLTYLLDTTANPSATIGALAGLIILICGEHDVDPAVWARSRMAGIAAL